MRSAESLNLRKKKKKRNRNISTFRPNGSFYFFLGRTTFCYIKNIILCFICSYYISKYFVYKKYERCYLTYSGQYPYRPGPGGRLGERRGYQCLRLPKVVLGCPNSGMATLASLRRRRRLWGAPKGGGSSTLG